MHAAGASNAPGAETECVCQASADVCCSSAKKLREHADPPPRGGYARFCVRGPRRGGSRSASPVRSIRIPPPIHSPFNSHSPIHTSHFARALPTTSVYTSPQEKTLIFCDGLFLKTNNIYSVVVAAFSVSCTIQTKRHTVYLENSSNFVPHPRGLKSFLSLVKFNPGLSTGLLLNAGLMILVLLVMCSG